MLKVIFYSLLGYYIASFIQDEDVFYGPISIFYGLFGLSAMFLDSFPIAVVYLLGIIWALVLNTSLEAICPKLKTHLSLKWLGLLSIVNVLFIDRFFDWIIENSHILSLKFIFIFASFFFLLDLALTMRKNT